ncbi:hypothetical protein Taro_012551 [Colocasia esculenta]|uniref:Uncharacterized protein n=1 Tax=Colocasia esculenta TaxID=4460 RepID=A0A843U9C4_COLES|nr:hypothetical protein [Colocasia esculenta]
MDRCFPKTASLKKPTTIPSHPTKKLLSHPPPLPSSLGDTFFLLCSSSLLPLRHRRRRPSNSARMAARAALMVAARRVSNPPTVTPPALTSPAVRRIPRRGLAGGADPHGPPKVNFWEDPLSPSKWKEEHVSIVSILVPSIK